MLIEQLDMDTGSKILDVGAGTGNQPALEELQANFQIKVTAIVTVAEILAKFLNHPGPKIRREMIHGIELRGRTHPEEVLPLLAEVQHDPNKKIREMVVHVLGQISYKKGCLEKVVGALKIWENRELVQ